MRVEARIAAAVAAHRAATAIEAQNGERLTYAELGGWIDRLARHLAELGAVPGRRVALVFENDMCVPVAMLAALRCGACVVPLNARMADAELDAILLHAEPGVMLFIGQGSGAAPRHGLRLGARDATDAGLPGSLALIPARRETASMPGDVACLMYTSGSTGRPKGVMLTHENLDFLLAAGLTQQWLRPGDRVLAVLPMSHSFGLTSVALSALAAGATLLPQSGFDAARVAAGITEQGVNAFLGVPAMYANLAAHAESHALSLRPNALRLAYIGGAPIDPQRKRRYQEMLGLTLSSGYGLTEAAPTVTRTVAERAQDDTSLGLPMPGVEIRILAPGGEVGVVQVRGPNVMRGYFKDPVATAAAIDSAGWLDTGDLARIDPAGRLHVVGRVKELIIRSGFNVYPQEVEQAICTHPDVASVAVLGRESNGNEDVVAFIIVRPGARLDLTMLKDHLKPLVAAYKIPSQLILRDALPLLLSGKIDKQGLRREFDLRA